GTITLTPPSGTASGGYYLLYFASDNGLLAGYDELASLPKTGAAVSYTVKEGTLLPPEATKIAVFESTTPFLDNQPSYASHVATVAIPSAKRLTLGTPNFTFGTTSDVHMNFEGYGYGAHQKWINTLNFFAAQNMDKVIITGDMTGDESEKPMTEQYEEYLALSAQSNYPLEDIHECIGNHGNTAVGREQFVQYTSGQGEERPTADSPWFSLKIDGENGARDNLFIFMAQELTGPSNSAICDNFSEEQMDWVESMLKTYADTDTNIFVIEHSPFLNYGPGDRHPGDYVRMVTFDAKYPQNMRLKSLIETHKNILLLSGHTHLSLYDNLNYSTENGTSCRMIHVPSGAQPATYNNANNALGSGDGRHTVNASYGSEAYTVRVYDEYIVFTGHNLTTNKIIPAACYILPFEQALTPDEAFEGAGTLEDPYLIRNAADFKALTNGFNESTSSSETNMYGYGTYFLQTADIDMTNVRDYAGTTATGGVKTYFAGYYNGGGHTLTVDIDADGMRSVFPYTYGVIANLHMKGRIHAVDGAQPVRSLYGHIVNCLFDMDLSALNANGLLYSNYSHTYNVYTHGTLGGNDPDAFACSDYSDDVHNVFHWYTLSDGTAVTDERGTRSSDAAAIVAAFNAREGADYAAAQAALGGMAMENVAEQNGDVVFAWKTLAAGDIDADGKVTTSDARRVLSLTLSDHPNDATLAQIAVGDIDGDGRLSSSDVRRILDQAMRL
ncbi:MAG: hypothetical protein IJC52_06085, partial [Clostridia bacterium]|nr:hypothetical protein [Clostridia bacterium]